MNAELQDLVDKQRKYLKLVAKFQAHCAFLNEADAGDSKWRLPI